MGGDWKERIQRVGILEWLVLAQVEELLGDTVDRDYAGVAKLCWKISRIWAGNMGVLETYS